MRLGGGGGGPGTDPSGGGGGDRDEGGGGGTSLTGGTVAAARRGRTRSATDRACGAAHRPSGSVPVVAASYGAPMRRTGFVSHERYFWHDPGPSAGGRRPDGAVLQISEPADHPDTKRRLLGLLEATGYADRLVRLAPRAATTDELTRFHDPEYVARVAELSAVGFGEVGRSAYVGAGTSRSRGCRSAAAWWRPMPCCRARSTTPTRCCDLRGTTPSAIVGSASASSRTRCSRRCTPARCTASRTASSGSRSSTGTCTTATARSGRSTTTRTCSRLDPSGRPVPDRHRRPRRAW